jgi:hypothetical protein
MATYASDLIRSLRQRGPMAEAPSVGGINFLPNQSFDYSMAPPTASKPKSSDVKLRSPEKLFIPTAERTIKPAVANPIAQSIEQPTNPFEALGYGDFSESSQASPVGQGVNSDLADVGLALMAYGENGRGIAPGSLASGIVGNAIAGQQVDAMAQAANELAAINAADLPGLISVSDENGNVYGYSSPATIAAADAAMFGESGAASDASGGYDAADGVGMSGFDNTGNVGAVDVGTVTGADMDAATGGGGEGGGGKIICTQLHAVGLMPHYIFAADQAFGKQMAQVNLRALAGYHTLARPVVKLMKRPDLVGQVVTKLAYWIATPWSREMAFRMGVPEKRTVAGWLTMECGLRLCSLVGRLTQLRHAFGH